MNNPNQAQAQFWNNDCIRNWIELDDAFDRSYAEASNALLEAADLGLGMSVLDIGCGSGRITIPIAQRTTGFTHGFDISHILLAQAGINLENETGLDIIFEHGDAQTYVFEKGRYDRVMSQFGMMFFSDLAAALRNLRTALKPQGTFTFICWGEVEHNPWFKIPRQIVADRFGPPDMDPNPAPANSPGPFGCSDREWVLSQMHAAGLKNPSARAVEVTLNPGDTIEQALQLTKTGPIAAALREKAGSEADGQAMRLVFGDALRAYLGPDGLRVPARINLFSASK